MCVVSEDGFVTATGTGASEITIVSEGAITFGTIYIMKSDKHDLAYKKYDVRLHKM